MLPSFFKQTITVIRPSYVESRGSLIPDWDSVTETTIEGCSVQPASTTLDLDGRIAGISDGLTAFVPPDSDIKVDDRIKYENEVYTINGIPQHSISPSGAISSIKLFLKRWEG